jgi:hypothetical protein
VSWGFLREIVRVCFSRSLRGARVLGLFGLARDEGNEETKTTAGADWGFGDFDFGKFWGETAEEMKQAILAALTEFRGAECRDDKWSF